MAASAVPTADTATTTKAQEFTEFAKQVLGEVFSAKPTLADNRVGHDVISRELASRAHRYRVYQIGEFLDLAARWGLLLRSGGRLMPGPKLTGSPAGYH